MPRIRVAQQARPAPTEPPTRQFAFPKDHHLVVTTQRNVLSWDARGLTKAFTSGTGGIHAAKEAKDGTNLLAIADSQVVLLHDTNRGMERSYRLKGTDGQIRLLEYFNDSKSLYFTTTLQNAVQSYSLRRSCLLEPAHTHPSPPTVLATSITSHLLLSASENPPTIYLQNLTLRTPPVLVQPRASATAAVAASFHPERPNVFLLAFRDGTLAAYDATRILGKSARGGQGGEIGRLKNLHSVVNRVPVRSSAEESGYGADTKASGVGSVAVGITGAAFLPGHRSRAISVGGDGRCRIVDFEGGAAILRTWHAKGPATSLSVLSTQMGKTAGERRRLGPTSRPTSDRSEGSSDSSSASYIIAVGRQDGKVLLFDFLGLLLSEQTADEEAGLVVDIEWVSGPGLKPATNPGRYSPIVSSSIPKLEDSPDKKGPTERTARKSIDFGMEAVAEEGSRTAIPSGDLRAKESVQDEVSDDMVMEDSGTVNYMPSDDTGTVNYVPMPGLAHRDRAPIAATNFMDLFSPVKKSPAKSPQHRSPRARARPRILSSTFKDNSHLSPTKIPGRISFTRPIPSLLPPTSSDVTETPEIREVVQLQDAAMRMLVPDADIQRASPPKKSGSPGHVQETRIAKTPISKTPRARKSRRVSSNVRMPGAYNNSSTSLATSSISSSSSSKILADIRRLGEASGVKKSGLALLAPYMNPRSTPRAEMQNPPLAAETEPSKETPEPEAAVAPKDAEPVKSPVQPDDIWLTSDDEANALHGRSRGHRQPSQRQRRHLSSKVISPPDTNLDTGHKNMMPPGAVLSPKGPVDVEDYFPRTSSLAQQTRNLTLRPDTRNGMGTSHDETQDCECGRGCCRTLGTEVRAMSEELRVLREQVEEMRRLMSGGR